MYKFKEIPLVWDLEPKASQRVKLLQIQLKIILKNNSPTYHHDK